ncbi:MAG: multiheme c-type cytochrome, partial [Longimicrobiales bacterium]
DHPDQETEAHRAQRIQGSIDGGMLRPSGDLYAVAANCFECHTVPIEDLVNTGGHTTGSGRFELVEWAGRIRHNYVTAQWESGADNREPSADRNRVTYAVGRLLDYEFGLRGLANATQDGRYAKGMERRVSQAYRQLEAVANLVPIPEVVEVLRLGKDLPLLPGNEARLTQAADAIRSQGQAFTSRSDGTELAALDGLVSSGRATVAPAAGAAPPAQQQTPPSGQAADPNIQEPPPTPSGDPNIQEPAPTANTGDTEAPPPGAAPAAEFVGVTVGQVRSRPSWIPAPDAAFEVIDPGCSCHGDAEDWWFDDAHQSSHFSLVNQQPKAVSIATLYGISAAQMGQGNQICMNCHGMPLSSNPSGQVTSGVGCESCHGGSSQYLDPHEDGGNPQLGMTNLKDAATRAADCSRCHLITDERLLASGHPSGSNYDFAAANTAIQHFPEGRVERSRGRRGESYTPVAAAALSAAYAAERSGRPVPQVQVVEAPPPPPRPTPAVGAAAPPAARTGTRVSTTGGDPVAAPPPPPRARPVGRTSAPRPSVRINLPPLPAVADSTAAEDILLLIKNRLQEIREAVGRRR